MRDTLNIGHNKLWYKFSPKGISKDNIVDEAKKGNVDLRKIFERAGEVLGFGISQLIVLMNPKKIIITVIDVLADNISTPDNIIINIVDMSKTKVQEAFFTGNISSSYLHSTGKWTLTGYVKNVTNYAEKRSLVFSGGQMQISAPRTYGGVLSVRF